MKTNWEHQKEAMATDKKLAGEDEHLREADKRHLKESEENKIPAAQQKKSKSASKRSAR
jgi:hypothetical protein